MRLTYEQQCQRADDGHTNGEIFHAGQWLTPDEIASLANTSDTVRREISTTAINLMPRDTSHVDRIATELRAIWGARS